MNGLISIYTRVLASAPADYRFAEQPQEDRLLWDKYIWPIAVDFAARRFLEEGAARRSRPAVRFVHAKIGYFVEVDLFHPLEHNRCAVNPADLARLADTSAWAVDPWRKPGFAWRKVTIRALKSVFEELLTLFADHRLEIQSGPQNRVYLQIPFEKNDWAKGFGARWDPDKGQWWIAEYKMPQAMLAYASRQGNPST